MDGNRSSIIKHIIILMFIIVFGLGVSYLILSENNRMNMISDSLYIAFIPGIWLAMALSMDIHNASESTIYFGVSLQILVFYILIYFGVYLFKKKE